MKELLPERTARYPISCYDVDVYLVTSAFTNEKKTVSEGTRTRKRMGSLFSISYRSFCLDIF